jgi:LysM repeat protein
MTIRELKDLNRLDGDNIIPRQKLVISKKYAQELEEKEERKSAAVADSSKSNSENGNGSVISDSNYYIVKSGDTLRKIAEMFNLNIDMLKAANNLKSDNIMADQRLLVKITSFTYKVRKGESLKKIADKFDTTIKKIKADNNLTSNDLLIGQKLKIVM